MPSGIDAPLAPTCRREDALAVLRKLQDSGHIAFFAGGCVRDQLLGLVPKDFDIATDALPGRVRQLFSNTQAVGAAFGVILVRHGRSQIEVATFRSDLEYKDGRRPEGVKFGSPEADARRRDFTINGLFLDPLQNDTIIDYVQGQADLQSRTLRAIGNADERFAEDHLRLLRAVRFAARFGLTIEPATAFAIARHASELPRISPERIGDELRRMLTAPSRATAWHLLQDFGLADEVFRFLPSSGAIPISTGLARDHRSTRASPGLIESAPPEVSFGLALTMALLEQSASDASADTIVKLIRPGAVHSAVQACRKALRISNAESDELAGILALSPFFETTEPTVATIKRQLATPTHAAAKILLKALANSVPALAGRIHWLLDQFTRYENTDFAPPPLVTGDDLTAAGAQPGPAFKTALNQTYDAQLEGRITTKEEARKVAMEWLATHPVVNRHP